MASAIVGQLIIAGAEVIWPSNRDLGDMPSSVSPIVTVVGPVTAGVAIVRAAVWAWSPRFLPRTLGPYAILVLIPVLIASDGPPAPLALRTIEGWDIAVVRAQQHSSRPGRSPPRLTDCDVACWAVSGRSAQLTLRSSPDAGTARTDALPRAGPGLLCQSESP
ncbi:hypothetical protein [Micromonospora sp. MS34]|uniref:hypothetical protein n=1 Tax=Micromonospora sp. MS34 TaxID=3385971 RepID=UPI0039A16D30